MTRTTRTTLDPTTATLADVEVARQLAQLARDNAAAERAAERQRQREDEEDRRRQREERQRDRVAQRQARAARVRQVRDKAVTVAPLLVVNSVAVGGQVAYGYDMAPATWATLARLAVAIGYALAVESVSLYVGWHAHDALMLRAFGTARQLRRASYLIAGVVAALNYSHFAGPKLEPTAFAVGCGLLSLLSPWLWGLHSRRANNVRLLAEGLTDEGGAEFSTKRWRAFPLRTWQATRWSIENNERDPNLAWSGYNADPDARLSLARRHAKRDKARHRGDKRTVVAGASVKPARDNDDKRTVPAGDSDKPAAVPAARVRASTIRASVPPAGDKPASDKERGIQLARDGKTAEEIAAALPCSLRSAQRYVKAVREGDSAAVAA